MPNTVDSSINRNISSRILSGEIGIGSSNFVAFAQRADSLRRIILTGFNIDIVSSDTQEKFGFAYLLEGQLVSPSTILNPTVNDLSRNAVLFYPFLIPVAVGTQIFRFQDRELNFKFVEGNAYSFVWGFSVGGAGVGDVRADLTMLGVYQSEDNGTKIRLR
jgi:hypothetical protein